MLFRKMLRTIGRYKAQFISMILMVTLGVGVFLGFNMEWVSLDENTRSFFEETHFADYRVFSEDGFSVKDVEALKKIAGIENAGRFLSVNANVSGSGNVIAVTVTEDENLSGFHVMEGEPYDPESRDGFWLFDHYAAENKIRLGDEMELTFESFTLKGKVKGLIESGEYMIPVRDETQLMPDFKTFGYAYLSPVMLKELISSSVPENLPEEEKNALVNAQLDRIYPRIHILSDMEKAKLSEKVNEALDRTLLILSNEENVSYAESQGEVEEGKTMGGILPVLFLAIAVLTMITTMHRIAAAEKTQIGTLKALGFKDRRILWHYTSFAAAIGIVGCVLGIALGFGIGWIIMNPDGMMGTYIVMPEWKLILPWWGALITLGIFILLTAIGFLSTRQMLRGTAADALRPYTPKKMRRSLLEKTPLWNRFSFGTRWNLRDILRHKARSGMTLLGILGCMVLITATMGMNDTASDYINTYYTDVAAYSCRVFVKDTVSNADAVSLADRLEGDAVASVSVEIGSEAVALDSYRVKTGCIRFLSEENEVIPLPESGALVCLRIAEEYDLKPGDSFRVSPYGTDEEYEIKVAGINRSMSKSVSISDTYAETLFSGGQKLTESPSYRVSSIYTKRDISEISDPEVSTIQTKSDVVDSFDSFMDILYLMIVLLIGAAVILGIVVLYNLGVMSYTERYREMATLKVVGFKDRAIGKLLISQNLWLSVIGIVIGLFAGIATLHILLIALASEYEMKVVLGPLTYIVSIALTLGVSLIVGFFIARKNRKIDMVAALKTGE